MSAQFHIFGIRHHGPGSARSLLKALYERKPDCVLIEGPADLSYMLPWLGHELFEPPAALVSYRPDEPKRAAYFPMAVFSPELQAARFALQQDIPVEFFDLPQSNMLAATAKVGMPHADPMKRLAEAAGYKDYERWWNVLIEQRYSSDNLFEGVLEMMTALREDEASLPEPEGLTEEQSEARKASKRLALQREAYMRQCIRRAVAHGYRSLAIVCGAYHGPALLDETFSEAEDAALLDNLPEVDVEAAWVPWSYSRMSAALGYGAGVLSPGWYHHLWDMGEREQSPTDLSIAWLSKVAELFRKEGMDASSAHIIESVRLAESLAAMRNMPFPGLLELNEATQTVMCFGDATPLKLIQRELIVGERMGMVPPDAPMVPLQRDLYKLQRELRLRPLPEKSTLTLDLRNDTHLARSHLLHRLRILAIPWGELMPSRTKGGTYREIWNLQWQPEFAIRVIEANLWGNTVEDAAANFAKDSAKKAENLAQLTELLDKVILAELLDTISYLMTRIQEMAALSGDIPHMMAALPPLARVLRYGSVRQRHRDSVQEVVDGLVRRICIGLPSTCASLSTEAATDMFERISDVHSVIRTLNDSEQESLWQETLSTLMDQKAVHGLIAGRCCRLLLDTRKIQKEDAMLRLERALFLIPVASKSSEDLLEAAFWIEGFLKGSGLMVVHDSTLWELIDDWVTDVKEEHFIDILPLLRRTFSSFSESARQQLHERVAAKEAGAIPRLSADFDEARAAKILPYLKTLLGPNHE